ncbi:MAG: phosphoglycerate kinase [Gemmatimonadetes bacterium]|nr:phosphoglycerate kinase [Gemmatimonadota bacterium]
MKKTILDADVTDKRILVRVDLDVPPENRTPADEARIRSALPTIHYLVREKARVILCGHLSQSTAEVADEADLNPLRDQLSELLQLEIVNVDDCVGPAVRRAVDELKPGDVLLLGNTEFYAGEKKNNPVFASELASIADLYVNDDFTTAHLSLASTEGAAHHLPAVAGLSFARQLDGLQRVREEPERPFVAVLGGSTLADKIGVIEHLLEQVDWLLVGGGVAMTFLKALGFEVGPPHSVAQHQGAAMRLMKNAGHTLVTPVDVVIGDDITADSERRTVSVRDVASDSYVLDIGKRSVELFREKLASARTVVWYGALGAAEVPTTTQGDTQMARMLAKLDADSIVGGREAVAAVEHAGVAEKLTLLSTGEETFLALLGNRELPGVRVLEDKNGSAPQSQSAS